VLVPDRLSGVLELSITGEPAKAFDLAAGENRFSVPGTAGI